MLSESNDQTKTSKKLNSVWPKFNSEQPLTSSSVRPRFNSEHPLTSNSVQANLCGTITEVSGAGKFEILTGEPAGAKVKESKVSGNTKPTVIPTTTGTINSVQSTLKPMNKRPKNPTTVPKSINDNTIPTQSTMHNNAKQHCTEDNTINQPKSSRSRFPTLSGRGTATYRSGERSLALTDEQQAAKPCRPSANTTSAFGCCYDEEEEALLNTADVVRISSCLDSGAVANVVGPDCVPGCTVTTPHTTGRHYQGAGGSRITKHGSCTTIITDDEGRRVICPFNLADVSRPLNSVSSIAGPGSGDEGPSRAEGNDVSFSNKRGVAVPPGTVERVLAELGEPTLQWDRTENLYCKDFIVEGFAWQGADQ